MQYTTGVRAIPTSGQRTVYAGGSPTRFGEASRLASQSGAFAPAQPAMGPRPISAPFGTPEFYQQLGQQNAAITGDPTWAKMGTSAQMAPQSSAETRQNMSVRDPGAWRARVTALTGQDPVAPGVQWAAANPSRDPRAALAQALMQRGGNLRAGFGPGRFRLNRV